MPKIHNKKRNIGIVYELLLRYISSALINENKKGAQSALRIIEKRFDSSTEIYKEFRLFNALAKSTISDTPVAAAILSEAKQAARRCNKKKLNYEKSLLIRDINHNLNDESFYHRRIPEYTIYATIQTLLNEWQKDDSSSLSKIIEYEGKVVQWLLSEKVKPPVEEIDQDVDVLVVKIMTEKLNKKFTGALSPEQRSLIKNYVFSLHNSEDTGFREHLAEIKKDIISNLRNFEKDSDNQTLLEKIEIVLEKVEKIDCLAEVSDETITKFLTISRLKNELREAVNNEQR